MNRIGEFSRRMRATGSSVALALVLTALGGFDLAAQTAADGGAVGAAPPGPERGFRGFIRSTEFGGLADVYFDVNSLNTEGDAPFRNFDTKQRQLRLSMAQLWLNKAPSADGRLGFNVRLNLGPAATMINAAEPGTARILGKIEQGYVSFLAPVRKGLQIDVGKFVTQHGTEVIEAKDNWNYSRSLLFALAIPYYHMGVRATYVFNDTFTLMGDVVNGWNNVVDNNGAKTFGLQAIVKPVPRLTIVQNYMAGPEQRDDTSAWRHLWDTTVTVAVTPALSFNTNVDYGTDTVAGQEVHWDGIAGYARYQVNQRLVISPRLEWFADPQGMMTGGAQTLKEATLTGEIKFAEGVLGRIEFRHDTSDVASFKTDTGAMVTDQTSVAFGLLYNFSVKKQ